MSDRTSTASAFIYSPPPEREALEKWPGRDATTVQKCGERGSEARPVLKTRAPSAVRYAVSRRIKDGRRRAQNAHRQPQSRRRTDHPTPSTRLRSRGRQVSVVRGTRRLRCPDSRRTDHNPGAILHYFNPLAPRPRTAIGEKLAPVLKSFLALTTKRGQRAVLPRWPRHTSTE